MDPADHNANDTQGRVRIETSDAPPDWSAFLADRADGTIYHDPRWGVLCQRVYGLRPTYLTARRGGAIVGILQLVRQKSLLFGRRLCSLPWFDASGILAADAEAADALQGAAVELRRQTGAASVELRQADPLDESLPTRTDKITMVLGLPEQSETLWDSLKAKVRNLVRKPQKEGCDVVEGRGELLEGFYRQYSRTMRDLGSPAHSRRFFRELCMIFEDSVRLFLVRQGDRTLAGSLTVRDDRALRVPWAGADWRFRSINANMLLYWAMLEQGCRSGAPAFDFGRCTRGAGTYRFKKQWGAEEVQLHWHYLLPDGVELPDLSPDNDKYGRAVRIWQKLPLALANRLGPRIIRCVS